MIDFLKEYEFAVQVFDDELGDLGAATLHFGPERWTHLQFGMGLQSKIDMLPKGNLPRPLKAICSDGACFTLLGCKRFDYAIGAEYIIVGETADQFKNITIRYSDISEWFLPWGPTVNTNHDGMAWRELEHIAAKIQVEGTQIWLKTVSETSVKRQGEDHIFHQHVLFRFEHVTGHFSSEDVRAKVLGLSNCLSILIAYPLSIVSVEVENECGTTHEFFFSAFKSIQRAPSINTFWIHCFARHGQINDQWETIFNGYFNSRFQRSSWSLLAGMQRYEGFWEYQTLGYVSLLDKYAKQRTENYEKIDVPANSDTIKQLEVSLKKIRPPLSSNQRDAIVSEVNKAFSRKQDLNFSKRYKQVISECRPDVISVINISDEDFKLIKSVRDKIAHGETVDVPEGDFTPIVTVVNKIALFLTYMFFLDVGLKDHDFLDCLYHTHSPTKLGANINRTHLDRARNPDLFLMVTQREFEKISRVKNIKFDACFIRKKSGAIRFSKKYSDKAIEWRTRRNVKSGAISYSEILGVSQDRITHLSPLYVESGEKILDFVCGWIIQEA